MSTISTVERYKTISEMDHEEIWYISPTALCFDFDSHWKELRALFHYRIYSTTKYISDYDTGKNFDISIQCNIIDGTRNYQIKKSNHNIIRQNLDNIPRKDYVILSTQEKIINIFDANQEDIDNEELEGEFFDFIESVLKQDDEDDEVEAYTVARNNFSDAIFNYCNKDNRLEIETILHNIVIHCENITTRQTVLDHLSDQSKCEKYLISLSKNKIEWFIDDETKSRIESIFGIFYETFIKSEGNSVQTKDKDKTTIIDDLELQLKKMLKRENYEEAARIREEIKKIKEQNKQ